jgi:quercetin dioxygenase-like cupin family protein
VVFVIAGKVEQWVEKEKRILSFGDAAFVPAGVVHASFNAGEGEARLVAIFGPSLGDGFETIEMSNESPWKNIRS